MLENVSETVADVLRLTRCSRSGPRPRETRPPAAGHIESPIPPGPASLLPKAREALQKLADPPTGVFFRCVCLRRPATIVRMSEKRLLLGLLVLAGVGLGYAAFAYFTIPEPGPTFANFERLRVGASVHAVEAALGPADTEWSDRMERVWYGDPTDGTVDSIIIRFSADGRAVDGTAIIAWDIRELRPPFSLLDTIKTLLDL